MNSLEAVLISQRVQYIVEKLLEHFNLLWVADYQRIIVLERLSTGRLSLEDGTQIALFEDYVIEESRKMLDEVFKDLSKNKKLITESIKSGLYEDRIIGTCKRCSSNLVVKKSRKGSRFIGCSSYPECDFALPLPKSGRIVITDKQCKDHGIYLIKIISKGKRPWDIGCPHCNFIQWQKKQENK